MSIEYAVTLYAQDNRSGAPASVADIARVVGEWAGVEDPESLTETQSLRNVGSRGASVQTKKLDLGPDQDWAWKFQMSHADRENPDVTWEVAVSALESPEADLTPVSVTLSRHTSGDRMLPPLRAQPKPPKIIQMLIASESTPCLDGGHVLSHKATTLYPRFCQDLARTLILDPDRRLPVIAISSVHATREPALTPADILALESDVVGAAHIYVIPPETQRPLSEALPEGLGVYNGGTRIWWPDVRSRPERYDHPLWTRERADRTVRDIARRISRAASEYFRPIAGIEQIERKLLRRELDRDLDDLIAAKEDEKSSMDPRQEDLRRSITREVDVALALAEEKEQEFLAERRKRVDLEVQVGALKARIYHLQGGTRAEPDAESATPGDESDEFIEAIRASYRERTEEADRESFPLCEIRLHPNFLDAVEGLQGINRNKIVEVCAEVACGRAVTLPSRSVHALRKSQGAESGQRIRASDGAKAYRCNLQTGTASARRLHWWRIDGHTIEFAHVGIHDDETCPE